MPRRGHWCGETRARQLERAYVGERRPWLTEPVASHVRWPATVGIPAVLRRASVASHAATEPLLATALLPRAGTGCACRSPSRCRGVGTPVPGPAFGLALGVPTVLPPARVAMLTAAGALPALAPALPLRPRAAVRAAGRRGCRRGRGRRRHGQGRRPEGPALGIPLVLLRAVVALGAAAQPVPVLPTALLHRQHARGPALGVLGAPPHALVPLDAASAACPAAAAALA
mmetsp:Transcript_21170/g.66994  ORF Transcript_21170/g.66994 Transcript_21170/m.66994 type:complete len:229 (-) Transcript_21170:367-1053(-)